MSNDFHFEGEVNLYLQGEKALAVDEQNSGFLQCYLGSKYSCIRIRDFRYQPRFLAERTIFTKETLQFKDAFCQPAKAVIQLKKGNVQIDLHEPDLCTDLSTNHKPILWLGVIDDGDSIPLRYVDWEIFRSIDDVRTGFAMLLPE